MASTNPYAALGGGPLIAITASEQEQVQERHAAQNKKMATKPRNGGKKHDTLTDEDGWQIVGARKNKKSGSGSEASVEEGCGGPRDFRHGDAHHQEHRADAHLVGD